MNIRTEAIVAISDVGLPLSLIAYEDTVGILDAAKYELTIRNVKYMDLRSTLSARFSDHRYGALFKDICQLFTYKYMQLNIFYKDDWKPFVYTFVLSVKHLFVNLFNKLKN